MPGFADFLGKVKTQAAHVGQQASAFAQEGSTRAMAGGSSSMQSFSSPGECDKAAKILKSFLADPWKPESASNAVPKDVSLKCKGIAVFTIVKAGFVFSGKAGSGIVVARLPDGSWSAPSCIATAGVGWGLQIGADLTEVVMILNSDEAVKAFSRGGNVTIGGSISAAAGPIGTGGQVAASMVNPAPIFSYSRSKGLFAGLASDGTISVERYDANRDFYGSNVSTTDISSGRVPAPEIASPMYDVIEAAEGSDESGSPDSAYVPGAHGESTSVPPANAAAAAHSGAAPSEGANPASKPVFDSAGAHS